MPSVILRSGVSSGPTPGSFSRHDSPFSADRMDELCRRFAVLVQNRSWGLLRDFLAEVERESEVCDAGGRIDAETPLAMIPDLPLRIVNALDRRGVVTAGELARLMKAGNCITGDGGFAEGWISVPGLGEVAMRQLAGVVARIGRPSATRGETSAMRGEPPLAEEWE